MDNLHDLRKILEELSEPFPPEYVEWRPAELNSSRDRALVVAYVDARRYEERLDTVCPDWSSKVEFLGGGVVRVSITLCGITRESLGESSEEDNQVTTAEAQAFRRACAKFGLGRYLYHLPRQWVEYDDKKKRIVGKPSLPDWALPLPSQPQKPKRIGVEGGEQVDFPNILVKVGLAENVHSATKIASLLGLAGATLPMAIKLAYLYRAWRNAGLEPNQAIEKVKANELPDGFDVNAARKFVEEVCHEYGHP